MKHVIHRVWLQGLDQMPDHLREMCRSFDQLHPTWEQQWWDHERILDELDLRAARGLYEQATEFVPVDAVNQLRADIARYAILRAHGGVTADVDYYWHHPIDQLLTGVKVAFAYEVDHTWVACGFMAATKNHTVFTKILDRMPDHAAQIRGRGLRANAFSGPRYLTQVLNDLARDDVTIFPAAHFHPVPWNQHQAATPEAFPDSYAVHAWAHQRGLTGSAAWRTW